MAQPNQMQMSTTPSARSPDFTRLEAVGVRLQSLFQTYERDRRMAELRWLKNARQFLGVYDPEIEAQIGKDRSKAYPKLTRVKCVSMLSRLMNLLFPTSENNWTINHSPVPNLSEEDMQLVLDTIMQNTDPNTPFEDRIIEMAITEFARERSQNLEREIEDQLAEIGGSRMVDYVSLCRKVLMSGIIYGMGVLKGPFVRQQQLRTWQRDQAGGLVSQSYVAMRPQLEFTSIWDYYPDMSAKHLHQLDGQFQRLVMARHQLRALADRDDFFGDVIKKYLQETPRGNYRRRNFETDLKELGVQNNVNEQEGRKYEVLVWDGYISGHDMQAAGYDIADDQLHEQVEAIVWFIDGKVIKADMNPWVMMEFDQKVNSYHHFIFEEDESTITGNGLPNIMRDSQMGVSSTARMIMDNGGVVCGPNLEVNVDLLMRDQDLTSVHAYKTWYREGTGPEAGIPAVKNVQIDSHLGDLLKINELFMGYADTETFVNAATGGDMSKGPSEPFRTATGASMLKGDAALPFKDVVRNFDLFTQSVLSSLVAFNMAFNPKRTIKGDHQVIPRGATSLMAKEVRGMILDNLSQTLSPEEKRYINSYELLRERLAARDIDVGAVLCDKTEAKRRDEDAAAAAQAEKGQTQELIRAEVRKTLAEATKSLTQADKNAAAADQTMAKTMIETINASMGQLEGEISAEGSNSTAKPAGGSGAGEGGASGKSGRSDGPSPVQVAKDPLGAVTK